jgi:MYXO-CTERM domain-containing protein
LRAAYDCFARSPALRIVARLMGVPLTRDAFLANRDQFYLVAFDPTDEPTLPPLPADLVWIWLVPAALALVLLGRRRRRHSREAMG